MSYIWCIVPPPYDYQQPSAQFHHPNAVGHQYGVQATAGQYPIAPTGVHYNTGPAMQYTAQQQPQV